MKDLLNGNIDVAKSLIEGGTFTEQFVTVRVEFGFNDSFEKLAKAMFIELDRICNFEKLNNPITEKEMIAYSKTIVWLHISNVLGRVDGNYKRFLKRLVIPNALAAVIMHIGEVVDRDYGIKFLPQMNVEADDILSPDDLDSISNCILGAGTRGFRYVTGFLKPTEAGTLEFMALAAINSRKEIVGYKPGHPVFGFFRSFFNVKGVEQVLGFSAMRIIYGAESYFDSLVNAYVFSSATKPARENKSDS